MSNFILLFFSLFFISSTSFSNPIANTTHKCSVQQTLDLLMFKENLSSINDTWHECEFWLGSRYSQVMINWNISIDCCDWNGVTCDHPTGDVIGLDLSCGMLQGTIHPNTTLFHLPRLQRLNLAYNDFTGSQLLPNISKVSNSLTHLNISHCCFMGQVPADILHLHKLVSLDLSYLHSEPHVFYNILQNLTVLKELSLEYTEIFSVLPTNINISSSLVSLNLRSTGLHGNLPHSIFNLQSLEEVDLSYNSFTGHIPSEITLLPKLVSLDLSWNGIDNLHIQPRIFIIFFKNFTFLSDLQLNEVNIGFVLPTYLNISSSLRSLSLSFTNLQGKLSDNILSLKYMEELDLSGNNNLCGPLPKVNTSTNNPLTWLDMSNTSLSGEIPTSIGHLTSLTHLYMYLTSLSGEIPTSIGHLKSLVSLQLSGCGLNGSLPCGLNGSLPKSIGNLKYLEYLGLSYNMLSGTLPSSLSTLPSLTILTLSNNQLTGQIDVLDNGPIQQTLQGLTNLTYLDLSYNNFRGEWELDTLLSSLTKLDELIVSYSGIYVTTNNANHYVNSNFRTLSLASCSLKVFPMFVRAMKTLEYLDLSSNDIHGHIPDWVGEIGENGLLYLDLSNNSLTGTIPDVYEDWGLLQGFILNGNQLEGKMPTSLKTCQYLRIIDLGNNHLYDTFPGWLGYLSYLQVLILRSNNLHGCIVTSYMDKFPFPCLRILDLSHNGFVGQLPTKYFQSFNAMKNVVKNNRELEYLYIGWMEYSFTIAMKGVDQHFLRLLDDYTIVDLSNNKFEGEIPSIIGNLNSLKVLDLSHNNLTGRIPQALGNILEIESLDLSWNQLIGEIPQSLAALTSLEFLNLSQNHLMGHIPQGKQFNTFEGKSFGGNPKLCGQQLPNKCSERMHEPQLEDDRDGDEEDIAFTWKVVMMGYGCGTLLGFVLGSLMLSTGSPKWINAIADADHMILKRPNKRR